MRAPGAGVAPPETGACGGRFWALAEAASSEEDGIPSSLLGPPSSGATVATSCCKRRHQELAREVGGVVLLRAAVVLGRPRHGFGGRRRPRLRASRELVCRWHRSRQVFPPPPRKSCTGGVACASLPVPSGAGDGGGVGDDGGGGNRDGGNAAGLEAAY